MTIILLQIAHNLHFAQFLYVFVTKRKENITFNAPLVYTLSFRKILLTKTWRFMRNISKNSHTFAPKFLQDTTKTKYSF
jgi:hypothetical protein